jgi:TatA/E family protein of Tat protein translocase
MIVPVRIVFGSLGFTEIAFILILALLLFGPKRLPEIGRTLGKGLAEFRRASNELRRSLETEVAEDERARKREQEPRVAPPTAVAQASTPAEAASQPALPAGEPAAEPVAASSSETRAES